MNIPIPFEETNEDFSGKTIILDIDGTLVPDNDWDLPQGIRSKVRQLQKKNTVVLCTNKNNPKRNTYIAQELEVVLIHSVYKKPNKKVLQDLPQEYPKAYVVIGDRLLTDGLLAFFTKSQFLMVKRKSSGKETWIVKVIYLIDDLCYVFLKVCALH